MDYNDKYHRYGRIWTSISLSLIIAVPFLMCIIFKETPDWLPFFTAFAFLAVQYIPVAIGEVFAYSYMLGTNGTYLAFITGNLSNLKIPCVINAINIAETKVGTEETELVSTISIAVSAITTILVIALGVLLFTPISPFLENEALTPAFAQVVFALFGALGGKYIVKYPKLALIAGSIMIALCLILIAIPATRSFVVATYMLFVGVVICFLVAKKLYGPTKDKDGGNANQVATDAVAASADTTASATEATDEAVNDEATIDEAPIDNAAVDEAFQTAKDDTSVND